VHFIPVHQLDGYARLLGTEEAASVPVTDQVAQRLLSLPLYPTLPDTAVDLVVDRLGRALVANHSEATKC
jgi:dTDP-4-amino-4,6-dideoxygalactose transaminase